MHDIMPIISLLQAGIETSLNDSKPERDDEAMNVLQGQTIHEAAKVGNLERMQLLSLHYPKLKEYVQ